MKRPVDLWALRIFVEVAITRSMTRAAERLDLTQSAVSQAIRKLEEAFGTGLIERKSIALTAAGQLLVCHAEPLLGAAERLPDLVREAGALPVSEIRLGLVDTFSATAGPGLIRSLTGRAARVTLWSGLGGSLAAALDAREVDAIVTSDPMEDRDGLMRLALWREPFILLVPRAVAIPAIPSLSALAALLPMIRFSARSHAGRQVDRHLRRIDIAPERRLEVDSADAMAAMVGAGMGWAVTTPLALLQGAAHASTTQVLPLPSPGFDRVLTLVCRADYDRRLMDQVAGAATRVLRETCLPRIAAMTPEIADAILIPELQIMAEAPLPSERTIP